MSDDPIKDAIESLECAQRWCASKGEGWSVVDRLGKGGTAPVFEIATPIGVRALKMYDVEFSNGKLGAIELKRIEKQLELCGHDCDSLVQVYEGGRFENRLYLLMSRAPGSELAKRLKEVPRENIRTIVDQVARAAIFLHSRKLCHRDIKAANIFISDDFQQSTLLDISVIRDIHDPIGVGSDNNGQLPVLATARYAPPEYLFRLLDPGPSLWHALNIYQLGALVHDLVMREPLFEEEYVRSVSNRYRFAWVIATSVPRLEASDVDGDILFTAQRALDKDWERRSHLQLEDFLSDVKVREVHAFQVLGLGAPQPPRDEDIAAKLHRLREISGVLEGRISQFLLKQNVIPKHALVAGREDTSKVLVYSWDTNPPELFSPRTSVELQLTLNLNGRGRPYRFRISAILKISGAVQREASIDLPELPDDSNLESLLTRQAESALAHLAIQITQTSSKSKDV